MTSRPVNQLSNAPPPGQQTSLLVVPVQQKAVCFGKEPPRTRCTSRVRHRRGGLGVGVRNVQKKALGGQGLGRSNSKNKKRTGKKSPVPGNPNWRGKKQSVLTLDLIQ